jgi:hypothetical protein
MKRGATSLRGIPARFRNVSYNGSSHPGSPKLRGFRHGANCQHFAYEFLRHFGFFVPNLRSSELWADRKFSKRVRRLRRFDLVLFNRRRASWGARVGVYLGDGTVLHLCKSVGRPAVWTFDDFAERREYRTMLGAKRFRLCAPDC